MTLTAPFICRSALPFLAVGLLSLVGCSSKPGELNLIQEGNKYVGDQSKNKVVEIYSDKSVGSLTPDIWHVVYYDPDATFKATEVKFGGGQKMDVTRPIRVLQYLKADNLIDPAKVKVASAGAVKKASSDPLIEHLSLKASQAWPIHPRRVRCGRFVSGLRSCINRTKRRTSATFTFLQKPGRSFAAICISTEWTERSHHRNA